MKSNLINSPKLTLSQQRELNKSKIDAKIRAKFGDKFQTKADKVDLSSKSRAVQDLKLTQSDISDNSPDSELTQEKLKSLMRTGGFHFSEAERRALSEILGE